MMLMMLNFITNPKYKEIGRLHEMLTEAGIPHSYEKDMDGWQVCYPEEDVKRRVVDAIEKRGSYGSDDDLLEIMGLLTEEEESEDSVKGWLTADDVFHRIKEHYEGRFCPHGGDTSEDCAGCAYACDYHCVDNECVRR